MQRGTHMLAMVEKHGGFSSLSSFKYEKLLLHVGFLIKSCPSC